MGSPIPILRRTGMGILSDKQIKAEVGITPLALQENRPGIISYGLSSYGYDCRMGYKFRVFKSYPCSIIDPKKFDERMLEVVNLEDPGHIFEADKYGQFRCSRCGVFEENPQKDNSSWKTLCASKSPDHIVIPPHSFILGESLEEFDLPRDILCVVVGKSTYARCGLIVNVTPGEPEWKGRWTIEVSNTTPLPAKVYCGEGIMQCLFFRADGKQAVTEKTLVDFLEELQAVETAALIPKTIRDQATEAIAKHLAALTTATCETSYKDRKGRYQGQTGVTPPFVQGVDDKR
jgi:dCTP deaminase